MIEFTGTDLLGENIEFSFEEIGVIYAGDNVVHIHGNPVRISSVKVKVEINKIDTKTRADCAILDEICVSCEEDCIASGKIHA